MKLRSPISLELVRQGYVRGSKEFKAAYQRELRRRNPRLKEREKERWRKYYEKKKIEDPSWNASRIKKWRQSNPGKWKKLSDRATANGIHRRFYEKHKTRLNREKAEYGKRKRRENPTFGLKKAISEARNSGDLGKLIKELSTRIDELD